jgi:hypothetical protein
LIVTRWSAVALVIGVASACDYTPDPTPVPSPSVTGGSTAPVVVVPAPTVTPIPTISPVPVPSSAFKIVLATPEDTSIIRLPSDPSVKVPRPILEFEFTYPQSLTLDSTHTDIEIGLRSRTFECLWTDVDYITRLDRDDAVYIANTVARFRTGPWRRRNPSSGCAPNRFTTDQVAFVLWTTPGEGTPYVVPMGWSFVPN